DDIQHVVDLTCEFNEPARLRERSYFSCPMLDGSAASAGQLRSWAEQVARLQGNIYIHCAEGHGRTGLFATAGLLCRREAETAEDALRIVRLKRPRVRLGREQMVVLRAIDAMSDQPE